MQRKDAAFGIGADLLQVVKKTTLSVPPAVSRTGQDWRQRRHPVVGRRQRGNGGPTGGIPVQCRHQPSHEVGQVGIGECVAQRRGISQSAAGTFAEDGRLNVVTCPCGPGSATLQQPASGRHAKIAQGLCRRISRQHGGLPVVQQRVGCLGWPRLPQQPLAVDVLAEDVEHPHWIIDRGEEGSDQLGGKGVHFEKDGGETGVDLKIVGVWRHKPFALQDEPRVVEHAETEAAKASIHAGRRARPGKQMIFDGNMNAGMVQPAPVFAENQRIGCRTEPVFLRLSEQSDHRPVDIGQVQQQFLLLDDLNEPASAEAVASGAQDQQGRGPGLAVDQYDRPQQPYRHEHDRFVGRPHPCIEGPAIQRLTPCVVVGSMRFRGPVAHRTTEHPALSYRRHGLAGSGGRRLHPDPCALQYRTIHDMGPRNGRIKGHHACRNGSASRKSNRIWGAVAAVCDQPVAGSQHGLARRAGASA